MLGGMSSVASAEYYRLLNAGVNERLGGHSAADLVLYSVDFAVIERCIREQDWHRAGEHLADRARRLERAGAELLLLATNTMHRVAPDIEAAITIPFLHIVDVTAQAALADGVHRLGVLGTGPVMASEFYPDRLAAHGIEALMPEPDEQALIHEVIFDELTHGIVTEPSRAEYLRIIEALLARGAAGVVLGCTEICLLIRPPDVPGVRLYDTTALHVRRAVELALQD